MIGSNGLENGLETRVSRGLGSQAYAQAAYTAIRLSEVPLLLHFWGARGYGEWLMLSAIPAYLALADGGFAGSASRDMSMRSAGGDRAGASAVFQSTAILLLLLTVGAVAVAVPIALFAPFHDWLGFQTIDPRELEAVLVLLVLHTLVGFHSGLLNGGFWCSGRYPLGMFWGTTTQVLEFAMAACAVVLGGGPVQAAAALLAGRVCGTLATRRALIRVTPWLRYGIRDASLSEIRRLAVPSLASLAFPLGNALNIQIMRLVVGVVLGPMAVAVFVPLRTLTNLVSQPRSVVNRLIEPELGMAFGSGDRVLFSRLFLRGCQAAVWLCAVAAIVLLAIAPWFWPAWTGGDVVLPWPLFLFLTAASVVNSVWYTALMVPYATNRHGRFALAYMLVYGLGAIVLAYVGSATAGLSGAGAALLIAELLMAAYVLPAALAMGHEGWSGWASATLRPPTFILSLGVPLLSRRRLAKNAG